MKTFAKLLFIIFCFFIALCSYGQCGELHNVTRNDFVSNGVLVGKDLYIKIQSSGVSIVAPSNQSVEITSLKDKKELCMNGSFFGVCSPNRLLQQIFNSKYNQKYYSISNNISSSLKNEICARGP